MADTVKEDKKSKVEVPEMEEVKITTEDEKTNWPKAILLMVLGIGLSVGLAYGVMKVKDRLKNPFSKTAEPTSTSSQVPQGAKLYVTSAPDLLAKKAIFNTDIGVTIRPPKGWTVDSSVKGKIIITGPVAPTSNGQSFQPIISIQSDLSKGYYVSDYKKLYMASLIKKLPDLKVLEERKLNLLGRPAILEVVEFTQDNVSISGEILLLVDTNTVYITTGIDAKQNWDKTRETIEDSIYSFNVL